MSYSSVCRFRNFRTDLLKPPGEVVVFSNLTLESSHKQSKQGILFIVHPPTLFSLLCSAVIEEVGWHKGFWEPWIYLMNPSSVVVE